MSAQRGEKPILRPFQFRLQTLMMIVLGICGLLALLRLLGADAPFVVSLFIFAFLGASVGRAFQQRVRGAIVGATSMAFYGMSIRVFEHIGHCAGWPGGALRYWEQYSALWWRVCDSPHIWRASVLWEYWYEDLQRTYGSEAPLTACSFAIWLLVACAVVWCGQRLHVALLLPFAVIVAALTGLASHDIDAAFLGLSWGVLLAIPLAGTKRTDRIHGCRQASPYAA